MVVAFTVRLPVVGGGAAHVTANEADVDPPAGTVTLCDVPPPTVQFDATPLMATVWLPAVRSFRVRLPLIAIACPAPPSRLMV